MLWLFVQPRDHTRRHAPPPPCSPPPPLFSLQASPTPSFNRLSSPASWEKSTGRPAASAPHGRGVFAPALLAPHLDASPPAAGRVSRRRGRRRVNGGESALRGQSPTLPSSSTSTTTTWDLAAMDRTGTDRTGSDRTGTVRTGTYRDAPDRTASTDRQPGAERTTAGHRAHGSATPGTATSSSSEVAAPTSSADWSIGHRRRDSDGRYASRFSGGSYGGLSSGVVAPGSGGGGGGGYRQKAGSSLPPRRASTGNTAGLRYARGRRGARTVVIEDAPPSMSAAAGGDAAAGMVLGRGSQQRQQLVSLSFCTVPLPAEGKMDYKVGDAGGQGVGVVARF